MKFSASSVKMLSQCGHKYYLARVKGLEEPGKKSYSMLQGDIVGEAIQMASLILNQTKELSEQDLQDCLVKSYATWFAKAEIPNDIVPYIEELIKEGISGAVMNNLDALSASINVSPIYKFKVPPPLKSGKKEYSTSRDRLGMKIIKTYEDVYDFFLPKNPYVQLIKDAAYIENEKYIEAPLGEPDSTGEQHLVCGYLDQFLLMADGREFVAELKYRTTPVTAEYLRTDLQVGAYDYLTQYKATVILFDVNFQRSHIVEFDDNVRAITKARFENAVKLVQNRVFMPYCGFDPYTSKMVMCGYKCGGCEYNISIEEAA